MNGADHSANHHPDGAENHSKPHGCDCGVTHITTLWAHHCQRADGSTGKEPEPNASGNVPFAEPPEPSAHLES